MGERFVIDALKALTVLLPAIVALLAGLQKLARANNAAIVAMLAAERDERDKVTERLDKAVADGNTARDLHAREMRIVSDMLHTALRAVEVSIEGLRAEVRK